MKKLFTFLLFTVFILCGCQHKTSLPVISNDEITPSKENYCSLLGHGATMLGKAENCIIGKNSRIATCAHIKNCIVLDGVTVTENYENAIVGRNFVEKVDFTPKTYLLRAKFYENLMSSRA